MEQSLLARIHTGKALHGWVCERPHMAGSWDKVRTVWSDGAMFFLIFHSEP